MYMTEAASIARFRRYLAEYLRKVERGEIIVLTRNGRPVVELRRSVTPDLDEPGLRRAKRPNAMPKTVRAGGKSSAFAIRERRRSEH